MKIAAIDPGRTGYLVLVEDGKIIESQQMPLKDEMLDVFALSIWLGGRSDMIILEKPFIPSRGHKNEGLTTQLIDYGELRAVCRLCCPKVKQVAANSWKSKLKIPGGHESKKISIERAKQYYPGQNFFRTERCKNEDHNLAEAALLAYYATL